MRDRKRVVVRERREKAKKKDRERESRKKIGGEFQKTTQKREI